MTRLPVVKDYELLKLLLRAGFRVVRWRGTSHAQLTHDDKPGVRLTLAIHREDVQPSVLRKTLRAAGVSEEEFRRLL